MADVELVWDCRCLLGEGPLWDAGAQRLRFVDIKGGRVLSCDADGADRQEIVTGGKPSFVVKARDGRLLAGNGAEIRVVGTAGFAETVATIPQPAHNRTNDATVDAAGRLWIATMDDTETQPTGTLWTLSAAGLAHAGTAAVVTNGPAVSADGRWLYHVSSGDRLITRFALTPEGRLGEGQPFVRLAEADGYPDGVILDAEGCLWVGLWDGWGVRRYAPDGALLLHVPLPCARVTKVALGGPDLTTAFVTTARVGLDTEALARQPLAGSLFAFAAPAAGLPAIEVAL